MTSGRTSYTLVVMGAGWMTSGRTTGAPAGLAEGLLDLLEEVVGRHAEPEQGQPEHAGSLEGDVVLPDRVTDDLGDPAVLDAVDLDDDAPVLPAQVQVVGAVAAATQDLAARLGQT